MVNLSEKEVNFYMENMKNISLKIMNLCDFIWENIDFHKLFMGLDMEIILEMCILGKGICTKILISLKNFINI